MQTPRGKNGYSKHITGATRFPNGEKKNEIGIQLRNTHKKQFQVD